MKQFFFAGVFIFWTFLGTGVFQTETIAAALPEQPIKLPKLIDKQPVLIELYTSERCAICPPADRNLIFLENEQPFAGIDLITLSLHVDYWNSGEWKDEFSSPMFTRRQDIYRQAFRIDTIYTPQMIVDGQRQFAGTDLAKAQKTIVESVKNEKGKIQLSTANDVNGGLKLKAKISDLPKHENSTVFLAVAESNLAPGAGGASAKPVFASVVRELDSLGFLTAEQNNLETETFLQFQPNWKTENLKVVVFVQENGSRKIFGVGKLSFGKK